MVKDLNNDNLKKVIECCYEMLELADRGDKSRRDSGCGVVYGTMRDMAYKVRKLAKKELYEHVGEAVVTKGRRTKY